MKFNKKKILKMVKETNIDMSWEDKKLAKLEENLLDAIEPILAKEVNALDRMAIAGTLLKCAMITYQQDLGDEAVADLLVEVAGQVDDGLLTNVQTIANQIKTIH
jgi:hypothetical protein